MNGVPRPQCLETDLISTIASMTVYSAMVMPGTGRTTAVAVRHAAPNLVWFQPPSSAIAGACLSYEASVS